MSPLETEHLTIIGLIVILLFAMAFAAAWSIGKVNTQLMLIHATLRDISGFLLLTAGRDREHEVRHNSESVTVNIEQTPPASHTLSSGGVPEETP